MIRLLVSGIDGMLVTSTEALTPAVQNAAKSLSEHGVELVLVSSRPPRGFAVFADALGRGSNQDSGWTQAVERFILPQAAEIA